MCVSCLPSPPPQLVLLEVQSLREAAPSWARVVIWEFGANYCPCPAKRGCISCPGTPPSSLQQKQAPLPWKTLSSRKYLAAREAVQLLNNKNQTLCDLCSEQGLGWHRALSSVASTSPKISPAGWKFSFLFPFWSRFTTGVTQRINRYRNAKLFSYYTPSIWLQCH